MIDSDRHPVSNRHPLTSLSQSDLRVFSNRRPFQILRSIICLIFNICAAYKYLL